MKKIVSLILAVILVVTFPAQVLATETSPDPTEAPTSEHTQGLNDEESNDSSQGSNDGENKDNSQNSNGAENGAQEESTVGTELGCVAITESQVKVELKGRHYTEESIGSATLGDMELTLENVEAYNLETHTTRTYILVDLSSPMGKYEEEIKTSINAYIDSMGENDEVVLIAFGAKVEKPSSFHRNEQEEAKAWVNALKWDQNFTFLYKALRDAYKEYTDSSDQRFDRDLVLLFSDCENDETNKAVKEDYIDVPGWQASDYYSNRCLPLYVAYYAGKFSEQCEPLFGELAQESGGALINFSNGNGFEQLLEKVQDVTLVTLIADGDLERSNSKEFVIEVNRKALQAAVSVSTHVKDTTAPKVDDIEYDPVKNVFRITFSEPVMYANEKTHYQVTGPNGELILAEAALPTYEENVYEVMLSGTVINGSYTWAFAGIKDASLEENPFKDSFTFDVENGTDAEEPTADSEGTTASDAEETGISMTVIIATVVLVVVLMIVLVAVFIYAGSRKKLEEEEEEIPIRKDAPQQVVEHTPGVAPVVKHHIKPNEAARICLRVITGKNMDQNIELDLATCVIVGRSTTCDIYIDDTKLSRQHFAIEKEGSDLFVTDLQSKNGTMLNGVRVNGRRKLNSGDKIQAGLSDITITVIGR